MIRAHYRAHLQLGKGQHAQPRLAFRIQNQAEIEIRLPHLLADGMAIRHLQIQLQPLPAGDNVRQRGGKAPFRQRLHHAKTNAAALQPLQLIKLLPRQMKLLLPAQQIVVQQLPGGGHAQPFRQALKQRRAEGLFRLQNLPVDGRSGNMQLFRRSPQAAAAGHFGKIDSET